MTIAVFIIILAFVMQSLRSRYFNVIADSVFSNDPSSTFKSANAIEFLSELLAQERMNQRFLVRYIPEDYYNGEYRRKAASGKKTIIAIGSIAIKPCNIIVNDHFSSEA